MPISKENKGGNYSKGETIQGRKLVYKRIQKGGNYSKEERNKRQETIQGNTVTINYLLGMCGDKSIDSQTFYLVNLGQI